VELSYRIRNCERTVGAPLSGKIGGLYGQMGLPAGSIQITLRGSAGQSFGAFNAPGVEFLLYGEANDYVGKGMAGGVIAIRPGEQCPFTWCDNVIAGNTLLYGATGGELYLAGRAGERFGVRNSGATAVVEGLGDHGCEYMTGGTVVVLGVTGYNFGAGMTGGVAYVLDEQQKFAERYNSDLIRIDPLNDEDAARLRALIERHASITSSPRAAAILQDWERYRPLFWRAMPKESVARIEAANEATHGVSSKANGSRQDKGKDKTSEAVPA
jgi:glutamate synthase (ferredoxin)